MILLQRRCRSPLCSGPSPLNKQEEAHVWCLQTAGWERRGKSRIDILKEQPRSFQGELFLGCQMCAERQRSEGVRAATQLFPDDFNIQSGVWLLRNAAAAALTAMREKKKGSERKVWCWNNESHPQITTSSCATAVHYIMIICRCRGDICTAKINLWPPFL